MTGRACSACHTRFLPGGFYWRTNASGNRSLVSSKCRGCFNRDKNGHRIAQRVQIEAQRLFAAYGHATLLVVNHSLPPGTSQTCQVLAGGGFVHLTEYNP